MQLIRRLTVNKLRKVFFTEEKRIYVTLPVYSQKDRVWSAGRKRYVNLQRIMKQRAKFPTSVMVSAGVSYGGKRCIHFVSEKAKSIADVYSNNLLPKLFEHCNTLERNDFIFQQDGTKMFG